MSTRYDEQYFVNRANSLGAFERLAGAPSSNFSLMLVRADEKMGKTWLLKKMERHARAEGIPLTRVDFRHPRDRARISDFLGLIRLLRDRFERSADFAILNATIQQFTANKPSGSGQYIARFSRKLETHGNLALLSRMATVLGINFENVGGENTLRSKAFEFVKMAFEGDLMPLLFDALEFEFEDANFPDGFWRVGYDDLFKAVSFAPRDTVEDSGAPIRFTTDIEYENAKKQINQAFFKALQNIVKQTKQVVILIDAWENAPDEIVDWVKTFLYPRIHDPAVNFKKVFVIVAGRATPDLSTSPVFEYVAPNLADRTKFVYDLPAFTGENANFLIEYMEKRRNLRQTDEISWKGVELLSRGIPGEIARFADIMEQEQAPSGSIGFESVSLGGLDDPFFSDPVP